MQITPFGTSLARLMAWAAGFKLVTSGYTMARVKKGRHAEELQRVIAGAQ